MSQLTNYIIRGAVASLVGLAIGEVLITTVEAVKIHKTVIKAVKETDENGVVNMESVKEAKSVKHFLKCMREAAIRRVKEIKKDPMNEIMSLWGCAAYLFGNWKGYWNGFKGGWDYGSEDVNRLIKHFKDKYPVELSALVKKAIDDKDSIELSRWLKGDTLYSSSWVAEACDLPKIKEVLS